jgi:prepilin-type N-terminal cleavage/methylation domain-containing protein
MLIPPPRTEQGFSLVELSIVLVILGLLTGGILTGQNLIRAAELRSVVAQYHQYQAAAQSFHEKYFAIPGDMTNATDFWGSAGGTGTGAACIDAQTTAKETCNGNGNGGIKHADGGVFHSERFLFWKHLSNAGMIEGNYTGVTAGASASYVPVLGSNIPASRISNAGWDVYYIATTNTDRFAGSVREANFLQLTGLTAPGGVLMPEEAWNIDKKLDDGSPVYGRMITNLSTSTWSTGCATDDTDDATYDLMNSDKACIIAIRL